MATRVSSLAMEALRAAAAAPVPIGFDDPATAGDDSR